MKKVHIQPLQVPRVDKDKTTAKKPKKPKITLGPSAGKKTVKPKKREVVPKVDMQVKDPETMDELNDLIDRIVNIVVNAPIERDAIAEQFKFVPHPGVLQACASNVVARSIDLNKEAVIDVESIMLIVRNSLPYFQNSVLSFSEMMFRELEILDPKALYTEVGPDFTKYVKLTKERLREVIFNIHAADPLVVKAACSVVNEPARVVDIAVQLCRIVRDNELQRAEENEDSNS